MVRKLSIIYAWFIRTTLFFLPDIPSVMRFRGFLYGVMLKGRGRNFQVAHSAILNSLSQLVVGDNVYFANGVSIFCGGGVYIGSDVLVGPSVTISSNNHTFEARNGYRFGAVKFRPVHIGSGSWLCANSVISAGSIFPNYSVLAPCSVFHFNDSQVERSLYSGVPAKFIKKLN